MFTEHGKRLGDVLLHHLDRYVETLGYLLVFQAFKAAHDEDLARTLWQAQQHVGYLPLQLIIEQLLVGGTKEVIIFGKKPADGIVKERKATLFPL